MEQLMEAKKYIYEIFSKILQEHLIKQIIIKTASEEEIEKYVDEKIVEFINRHSKEPKDKIIDSTINHANIDWEHMTMEKMDQFENNSWYITKNKLTTDYRERYKLIVNFRVIAFYTNHDCVTYKLNPIRNFLKINEIKIIKGNLEQYLISS